MLTCVQRRCMFLVLEFRLKMMFEEEVLRLRVKFYSAPGNQIKDGYWNMKFLDLDEWDFVGGERKRRE